VFWLSTLFPGVLAFRVVFLYERVKARFCLQDRFNLP